MNNTLCFAFMALTLFYLMLQIEDRAIEDLINFYNANEACEERITVRRVLSTNVACPVWVTSKYPQ